MSAISKRKTLDRIKADFRRKLAEFKHSRETLLEIFGMAIRAKLSEPSNKHNSIGKHYFGNHGGTHHLHSTRHHPATTKLARAIIRANGVGITKSRRLYKSLTGEWYQGVEP